MIVFRSHSNAIKSLRDPLNRKKWELNIADAELEQSVGYYDNDINYAKKNQVKHLKPRHSSARVRKNLQDLLDDIGEILGDPDLE
jgi:hypothetical protein